MKVQVKDTTGKLTVDEVDAEGVYFFNAETHGSAEALLERTEELKDAEKVIFVNAANVQSVSISDFPERD